MHTFFGRGEKKMRTSEIWRVQYVLGKYMEKRDGSEAFVYTEQLQVERMKQLKSDIGCVGKVPALSSEGCRFDSGPYTGVGAELLCGVYKYIVKAL